MARSLFAASLVIALAGCAGQDRPLPPPVGSSPATPSAAPSASASASAAASNASNASNASPPASSASASTATVPNIANSIAMLAKDFRACFERGLEKDPSMHGVLSARVVIGAQGAVKDTRVVRADKGGGPGLSDEVLACVETSLRGGAFAPPEGGPEATIVVPLSFVPDAPPPATSASAGPKKPGKKPKPTP